MGEKRIGTTLYNSDFFTADITLADVCMLVNVSRHYKVPLASHRRRKNHSRNEERKQPITMKK